MLRVAKINSVKEAEAIFPTGQDIYYDAWIVSDEKRDNNHISDNQNLTTKGPYPPLRPILIGSTILGLTSFSNVFSNSGNELAFYWTSLPMAHTAVLILILTFTTWFRFSDFSQVASETHDVRTVVLAMGNVMFYFNAATAILYYVRFSRLFPTILRFWNQTADRLKKYSITNGTQLDIYLSARASVIYTMVVFILPSFLELSLHDANVSMSKACENTTTFLECLLFKFSNNRRTAIQKFFAHDTVATIFNYVANITANLAWNFSDLLITIICLMLNANFRVITTYLERVYEATVLHKIPMDVDWNAIRTDHFKMCEMVKKIDNVMAPLTLQSYAFNIYGLCYQVYYGIRPQYRSSLSALYAFISFVHLTNRICAVSFAAGRLYDQIKAPLRVLHRCPASSFNNEAFRFLTQIYGSDVGLTGSRFFMVNQKLLLGIASLIFTYELILLD